MTNPPTYYFGLDPTRYQSGGCKVIHLPLIAIKPLDFSHPLIVQMCRLWSKFSHVILTSRNSAKVMVDALIYSQISLRELGAPKLFAIGPATALILQQLGLSTVIQPHQATAEGMVQTLKEELKENHYLFYPHSHIARPVIAQFLKEHQISHFDCPLYQTIFTPPLFCPTWEEGSTLVFTSPSTIQAFLDFFKKFPLNVKFQAIGPITSSYLAQKMQERVF